MSKTSFLFLVSSLKYFLHHVSSMPQSASISRVESPLRSSAPVQHPEEASTLSLEAPPTSYGRRWSPALVMTLKRWSAPSPLWQLPQMWSRPSPVTMCSRGPS